MNQRICYLRHTGFTVHRSSAGSEWMERGIEEGYSVAYRNWESGLDEKEWLGEKKIPTVF